MNPFNSPIVLSTDLFELRPMTEEHTEELVWYSEQEPEIWTYSTLHCAGRKNMLNYMAFAFRERDQGTAYPFVVIDKQTGKVAGSTRFYDIQLSNSSLQLGYTWYSKHYQGKGINAHSKFMLLQFAFEELALERVEFRADNRNAGSIAAMKKLGCTVEGVLRSHAPVTDGTRRDTIVLSILRNEWFESVKPGLMKRM